MTTIKSSTTLTTAYSVEANTTGALVIQTGATPTTAVTVDASQNTTFAGTVAGTSFSGSGASLTSLNATNISSGTVAKARLPTGTVLQVVNANLTTVASTASLSATTTGLTATITPTSSTSKILVIVNGIGSHSEVGANQGVFRMVRNIPSANTVVENQATSPIGGVTAAIVEGARTRNPVNFSLYDSPATTSAITYTLQFFTSGGGTVYLGRWGTDANFIQSTNLTLMEIAA
jgi:hypothetical protein